MMIRKYLLLALLFALCRPAAAQKLSFSELTASFELSPEKLDSYMKSKNYIFLREDISKDKIETMRVYWESSPKPEKFYFSDTYLLRGKQYNYRLRYSTLDQSEFKEIEALLISKKYKKEKIKDDRYKGGIVIYSGGEYRVELKVIRVGLADSYMVSIFNDKLGMVVFNILGDQLLRGGS